MLSGCTTPDSTATPTSAVSTNADGLTYGSAMGASGRDTEPDLIQVETEDGTVGYVRKDDLYAGEPANPTEAVAQQEERDRAALDAAYAVVADELGVTPDAAAVDLAAGTAALQALREARATGALTAHASTLLDDLVALGAPTVARDPGADDADVAVRVIDAADASGVRLVPVYESDGRTVIGEFPVGG
ncbi:hypothetical protein CBZ_20400 [Cellulomonas biazotea]|uniref:Uncharacterized protein n=1 Tax=Cellulomonas biazotea TaxID=1709 RepID=A0A402DS90_9CELL|nr:hypothetical protein CBZ_20400 [Cellulomonas biazotea]